jgi:hypothetical protein
VAKLGLCGFENQIEVGTVREAFVDELDTKLCFLEFFDEDFGVLFAIGGM